jgi:hypothetical protein
LGALERSFKQLQGEWDDHYDKQRRMLSRIVKTHAKITEHDEQTEEVPPEPMNGQEPGSRAGFLSPKQRLIQQQILQRRQMNGGK